VDLGLHGKVAVVTGGAGAIGGRIAVRLAEEGCDIVLVDLAPPAEGVEQAISASGRRSLYARCEVRQAAEVDGAVRRALDTFGKIDILVNGAGTISLADVEDLDEAEWDRVVDINLKGAFLCSRAVIPHLKAQRSGTIVNVASGLGHTPVAAVGHYAAAAAGVIALGRTLALELAPHKINVNTVAPGIVDGERVPWHLAFSTWGVPGSEVDRVGLPDDVAKAAVFLASSAFEYVTGQTIFVNGGALMP
jgi:NAD(P)-dependent dehydrogenase (short-subunit alcohol dehydrogenase family)